MPLNASAHPCLLEHKEQHVTFHFFQHSYQSLNERVCLNALPFMKPPKQYKQSGTISNPEELQI